MSKKPLVSVVIAVYNPNKKWFLELINSVIEQNYSDFEIVVRDDCSTQITINDMKTIFDNVHKKVDYRIYSNSNNLGSNKTYELLINDAKGEYIVFCDQDDVWEKDKIITLYDEIVSNNAVMSYSDVSIIDSNGKTVSNSMRELRKRIKYVEGYNITLDYLFKNCTAGCTIMIKTEIAKLGGKVPLYTYWDHWICLIASLEGRIVYVNKQLIRYRLHGNNQSGIMAGITSKADYYRLRVMAVNIREKELLKRGYKYIGQKEARSLIDARMNKDIVRIVRYSYLHKKEAYFDIIIKYLPEWIFKKVIERIKKR